MSGDLDPMFVTLRERALAWQDQDAPEGSPSGVILETGYREGVVMLVVMSDGTVDLYFSGGSGVMGAGALEGPKHAARELAAAAAHFAPRMPVVTEFPLPPVGSAGLYVLIDGVVRGGVARERDYGDNRSQHSPLFHIAHRVIAEIRRLPPQPQF
ncbi:MAG: hypothetical protein AB7G05_02595 [Hyphomonadaceae bacterium]